jgi:hypothetical protein
MSVTITRRKAIELAEEAISLARLNGRYKAVKTLREHVRTSDTLVRGGCEAIDVDGTYYQCPMYHMGLICNAPGKDNDDAWTLAFAWDDATRDAGLALTCPTVIRINPLT